MTTWAIIYNPTSGNFRQDRLEAVCDILRGQGIQPTLHATQHGGHATALGREINGVECIVAHGGDGTLNEVANGVLGREVSLAYLPGGTANAMAFELGLPHNPVRAVRKLVEAHPVSVRPGVLDGRVFMLMGGIGFDAQIVYLAKGAIKARLGAMAFVAMGLRVLWHPKPQLRVTLPDGNDFHGVWAVGSRARRYGGRLFVHPQANLESTQLGVSVISKTMIAPFFFTHLLTGIGWQGGGIAFSRAEAFQVESDQPVPAHVDGEHMGYGTRFQFSQSEQRINFIIPGLGNQR